MVGSVGVGLGCILAWISDSGLSVCLDSSSQGVLPFLGLVGFGGLLPCPSSHPAISFLGQSRIGVLGPHGCPVTLSRAPGRCCGPREYVCLEGKEGP